MKGSSWLAGVSPIDESEFWLRTRQSGDDLIELVLAVNDYAAIEFPELLNRSSVALQYTTKKCTIHECAP
jgi:hypothetical protein